MSPVQSHLIDLIRQQPEDATWDQLLEQLHLQRLVDEGLEDVRAGRTVSNQDALETIRSWH
jgi:predicted transcriptional regulator